MTVIDFSEKKKKADRDEELLNKAAEFVVQIQEYCKQKDGKVHA